MMLECIVKVYRVNANLFELFEQVLCFSFN